MSITSLILFTAIVGASTATSLANQTNVSASCTITLYSQVSSVVSACTSIVVDNLSVPAGKTLDLNLKPGSSLTFKGVTTFETGLQWVGPLLYIRGSQITITGDAGHRLDGQGASYWDGQGGKGTTKPKFLKIKATDGSIFRNLTLLNCPLQCVAIRDCDSVTLSGFTIDVSDGDVDALGHNTDGFDIGGSTNVTIKNSTVKNQDDCVAVNSGKNMNFNNLICSGGHGLSLSVGMSKTSSASNVVSNISFHHCKVKNSLYGIHVKTHPDAPGGTVSDVTYSNIVLSDITDVGVNVQQDYGGTPGTPSNNIAINGLILNNVTGTMTGTSTIPVNILCGSGSCSNFKWSGISIWGAARDSSCNYIPSGFSCN